jgi:hypothetical protein
MIIRKHPRMKIGKIEKTDSTKGTLENIVQALKVPKVAPSPITSNPVPRNIRKPNNTRKLATMMSNAIQES